MFFQHVYDKSLSQGSYFIGCQKAGVAAVIDAKRDVDTYLAIAKENSMTITHIFETHIHADFLAGSRELAALTGARLFLSDEGGSEWQYEFPHEGLRQGDKIGLGNLSLDVLHTPGHTPESISLVLTDHPASAVPVMLFTGDFVFVGDIGRPDLLDKAAGLSDTAKSGAIEMHDSLKKFTALPDYLQVWPGHGAGSACGKSLGAVPGSTVGYEKISNWAFQYQDDQPGFIEKLLADQLEPPTYFAMMKKLNKADRPLLTEVPGMPELSTAELMQALAKGIKLIDTRDKMDFADGFIPGSYNIQGNNAFATWAGWLLNYEESFILLAAPSAIDDLSRKLMRIGLDKVAGYIPSPATWTASGGQLEKATVISFNNAKSLADKEEVQVVDLREASEFNSGHIAGATHVFVGTLSHNLDKISRDKKVVIHCQSGDRATIGYSILAKNGFTNVVNFSGGINEWVENRAPLEM